MKKVLSLLVAVMLLTTAFAGVSAEEMTYSQAPMFDEMVSNGQLPPLEERLPENPKIADDRSAEYLENGKFEIGNYGGTLRSVSAVVNYNADVFIMMTENICTMVDTYSGNVTPNLVEAYEVNDDYTEYTFHLRKGLKWSDGVEVTMEDFRFAIEDYIFNSELTPVIAAYFRDGGVSTGDPMSFEVIDETTFRITFKETFGGFLAHMSVAGWKGYAEILKPAHFMKRFHKDYAEEIHGSLEAYYAFLQPYGTVMGYDDVTADGVWAIIMDQIDVKNGEMTDPMDMLTSVTFEAAGETGDFPVLYPWIMESDSNNVTTWVRNPYYFKVDAEGNQLPYIDRITSTLVEDMEMVQMKIATGEVDYMRESATINNVTLYAENADKANIDVHFYNLNNTPTDVSFNMTYGLNTDGTVKDDELSQAWQEVINDKRFRQALMQAVDTEEIIDAVYKGFAEPDEYFAQYEYDVDAANALLDEMGMFDVDGDGFRETPSGKKLTWFIYNAQDASDIVPVCELLVEFWNTELGLNVTATTTESSLLSTMMTANEVPMRVIWEPIDITWYNLDWGQDIWCPLWKTWWDNGGANAEDPASVGGLQPSAEGYAFFEQLEQVMTVTPAEAVSTVLPGIHQMMADNLFMIIPLQNVQQSVVASKDLSNIPVGGVGIAGNFVAELFYYTNIE